MRTFVDESDNGIVTCLHEQLSLRLLKGRHGSSLDAQRHSLLNESVDDGLISGCEEDSPHVVDRLCCCVTRRGLRGLHPYRAEQSTYV